MAVIPNVITGYTVNWQLSRPCCLLNVEIVKQYDWIIRDKILTQCTQNILLSYTPCTILLWNKYFLLEMVLEVKCRKTRKQRSIQLPLKTRTSNKHCKYKVLSSYYIRLHDLQLNCHTILLLLLQFMTHTRTSGCFRGRFVKWWSSCVQRACPQRCSVLNNCLCGPLVSRH